MRDEMDARMWNQHHDQFSKWAGEFLDAATGVRLPRLGALAQVIATFTALSMTLLTFGGTV